MDTMDYHEMVRNARRELEHEQERLTEKMQQLESRLRLMDGIDGLLTENQKLKNEIEVLQQQLNDEKKQRAELEMKLAEMKKISEGMAKKASEEAVLAFLRTYVNHSKRKTADKRAFAKQATLETANANGLTLPLELAATIESLDDETPDPKVVNVSGNYNDIHNNGGVSLNEKQR